MEYDNTIRKYFPYSAPRKGQVEAINSILEGLESYDYAILDAETGFGKSAVARTILDIYASEKYKDSYLLTSTKMLQEQYYSECANNPHYVDYKIAKGRGNFLCRAYNALVNCNQGFCQEDSTGDYHCKYGLQGQDPRNNGGCYYWEQKADAIKSDVAIMNYDVLLSDFPNHYKYRDLMILDEAHNIDNKVLQRVGLTLNSRRLEKLVDFKINPIDYDETDIDYWLGKLNELNQIIKEHLTGFGYNHTRRETDQLKQLGYNISKRIDEISFDPSFWFVFSNKFEEKVVIKPRDVRGYVKPLLLDNAKKHLFMSGSIINKSNFIKYLGLDEDDVFYHNAESSFDMKNRNPIIQRYCGSLTYKQKEKTLPKTYETIRAILKKHDGEKGIIHCNSKEFKDKIMQNVKTNRFLSYESSLEKEELLDYFKNSLYDNVIVAYSLEEGVDLPYDNISFQIIFKTPYPYLGDPQIKARKDVDPDWYMTETIRKLVQIHGRGMRAEDDSCVNYVLDSSFKGIIRSKLCPSSFKECVR